LAYLIELKEGEAVLEVPERSTLPFPASLDVTSPITPWPFETFCTSPILVYEPDRRGLYDQICNLSTSLFRGFSFKAHPVAILLREPAAKAIEDAKDDPVLAHVIVIGGSNAGKLIDSLRTGEANILDLTQPEWIPTEQNVQKVVGELDKWCPMMSGTIGVILDLFGNASVKFRHVDDSLVLPMRVMGKHHLLGDVVVETDEGLRNLLRIVDPIFEKIREYPTVVNPPMPRYIFGGCCREATHAPNSRSDNYPQDMLNGFAHARSVMKTEMVSRESLNCFWMMESPSFIERADGQVTMQDKLEQVRLGLGPDGVHLTDRGLNNLLQNMSDAMVKALHKRDMKVRERKDDTAPVIVSGTVYYWRGFASPKGSGKRPPASGRGGGPVRGGGSGRGGGGGGRGKSFGGSFGGGPKGRATPYDRNKKK
jgi:hypothetical protein